MGELKCHGCGAVLARACGFHLEVAGSRVQVTGRRIRIRCPKCRRVRSWHRPTPDIGDVGEAG